MASLIYSAIGSLDGYIEDAEGKFDWAAPDEEVHAFVNDLDRSVGTFLLGRRMYETLQYWETSEDPEPHMRDFAELWRAADKVVYSRTLDEPSTARTRVEREFDPDTVRRLKESAERDLVIGGPELATHAFRAGLVDDCHLFLNPIMVGAGKRALPDDLRLRLELLDERRFGNGVVFVRYRVAA
jgi:dihydrofolate reductase